tara:strand:+ start:190 stop:339 length:150 start_codon:yes stop_codon:yes gene_type:complete
MRKLIQLHKDMLNDIVIKLGLSLYQVLLLAFVDGLIVGTLLACYLPEYL